MSNSGGGRSSYCSGDNTAATSSSSCEENNLKYFKDIPIIKFPDSNRNCYYMCTEDISNFLGGIIPASDIESLFNEFRSLFPKKVKHEKQEFIKFKNNDREKKKNKEKFTHVRDTMLLEYKKGNGKTPKSVIEAIRNSSTICFLNAERVHQMLLNSLMESETELESFILMRSILDEKIIKSPYKSTIGIRADYPTQEQKKEGNVDIVFPPEFKHSKHTVWTITNKEKKKKTKTTNSSEKSKSPATGSSSTCSSTTTTTTTTSETFSTLAKDEKSQPSLFLPLSQNSPLGGGFEMDSPSPPLPSQNSPSPKIITPSISNSGGGSTVISNSGGSSSSNSSGDNSNIPILPHSLISIGSSTRILYSIDISKSNSISLTVSIKEYDEAIKTSTEKHTRNITLSENRIRDFWILEYAFGMTYPGGIVGIPSCQYFNSGMSIVLDANLRPLLDQLRTKITTTVPFSLESIQKKGIKSPQQLITLVTATTDTTTISTSNNLSSNDNGNGNTHNITSSSSSITTCQTNPLLVNTTTTNNNNNNQSQSNTTTNTTNNSNNNFIKPINEESRLFESTPTTIVQQQQPGGSFSYSDNDGKIDLNQCGDIGSGFSHYWEEATTSSDPIIHEENDAYSDSHSACYDDDEPMLSTKTTRKRKTITDDEDNDYEPPTANTATNTTTKKAATIDEIELIEPPHITVLKRLLQFNMIREEDFQNKLKLFQSVEEYKSGGGGSLQPLQGIINSHLESLNNFSNHENFICPLSKKFILDPVLAPDGLLYDRTTLSHWITTYSSINLLGGCRVSSFTNMPAAVEEVNKILSPRIEKEIEFVEQIVNHFNIYCQDLLPLLDQLLYYDSSLNRYRRKLLELKFNILLHNLDTTTPPTVDGRDLYCECGKEIIQMMESDNNRKIQFSISILKRNPKPDYYFYFSNIIYQCCNRSIVELKTIPNIIPKLFNNILTALVMKKEISIPQFLTSIDVSQVSSEPIANQWFHMLLLLNHKESELLSSPLK